MRTLRENHLQSQIEALLPAEWDRLVRLCASISGNADAAEDLAQEAMIEAWRHAENLRDPHALRSWLTGIARNVCLRWVRHQGREAAKLDRFARSEETRVKSEREAGPGDEMALERDELASLLEHALKVLPASTRDVLIQHYIDERPQGEIAEGLGVSEGAIAVRIHRGKLALKQSLAQPEMSIGAVSYGLVDPDDVGWQYTRIWCPFCGRHRLSMRIDHRTGMVGARCTGPCFSDGTIIGNKRMTAGAGALTSAKSILRRELIDLHGYYRQALTDRGGTCHGCGRPFPLDPWPADGPSSLLTPYAHGVLMTCRTCGAESSAPLSHLLLDTPLIQQFWRRHPRMQILPVRQIEMDGRAALLCGFTSVDARATVEIVSAADTYEILSVDGGPEG